jgi:hypothetical protein
MADQNPPPSQNPLAKLADRVTEQREREQIAANERKRTIALTERVDPGASIQNSVPHILNGVQAGPDE